MFNYKRWNQNSKIAFLTLTIALFAWAENSFSSAYNQEVFVPRIENDCFPLVDNQLKKDLPCKLESQPQDFE